MLEATNIRGQKQNDAKHRRNREHVADFLTDASVATRTRVQIGKTFVRCLFRTHTKQMFFRTNKRKGNTITYAKVKKGKARAKIETHTAVQLLSANCSSGPTSVA